MTFAGITRYYGSVHTNVYVQEVCVSVLAVGATHSETVAHSDEYRHEENPSDGLYDNTTSAATTTATTINAVFEIESSTSTPSLHHGHDYEIKNPIQYLHHYNK